jgi:hypothetical protein
MNVMMISKEQILNIVNEFPKKIDLEELMYRFYMLEKIQAAEEDIRKGRVIPHEEAMKQIYKHIKQTKRR